MFTGLMLVLIALILAVGNDYLREIRDLLKQRSVNVTNYTLSLPPEVKALREQLDREQRLTERRMGVRTV